VLQEFRLRIFIKCHFWGEVLRECNSRYSSDVNYCTLTFKDEAQTASFKDPIRIAQ